MRRRAVLLVAAVAAAAAAAAAAPCACDGPSGGPRPPPARSDSLVAGWHQLQKQAAHLERRALVLHSDSATTSSLQTSSGVRSTGPAAEGGDLRAAALELRGQLEAVQRSNERALPEIRLEVSKLETAVIQAQARAARADQAQEGTQRWVRAVVAAYGRRAARNRHLLLRLSRALATVAHSGSLARARSLLLGCRLSFCSLRPKRREKEPRRTVDTA